MKIREEDIVAEGGLSYDQALACIRNEDREDLDYLLKTASSVTRRFHGRCADLCSIVNAKSGLCSEDCRFCAQSTLFPTHVSRYPLADSKFITMKAKAAQAQGAGKFCIVTSGRSLTAREFQQLLEIIDSVQEDVDMQIDVSIGFLNSDQAKQLKSAGISCVNHNLQTSSAFYGSVATTHSYADRVKTLRVIKNAGLELCCGVLFGIGESREDRVKAAFEIKPFSPECVPINLLDARPGTPLEHQPLMDPYEILKTIAVFRLILLKSNLKLAGGRGVQLGRYQRHALEAGINGLITGEYLTTKGNDLETDRENLRACHLDEGQPITPAKKGAGRDA